MVCPCHSPPTHTHTDTLTLQMTVAWWVPWLPRTSVQLGCKSEVPTVLSSDPGIRWNDSELGKAVYLLDYWFIIKGTWKDVNEQPDEEINRAKFGRVPSTGVSVPVKLWDVSPSWHWDMLWFKPESSPHRMLWGCLLWPSKSHLININSPVVERELFIFITSNT